jgi:hypothetical protein
MAAVDLVALAHAFRHRGRVPVSQGGCEVKGGGQGDLRRSGKVAAHAYANALAMSTHTLLMRPAYRPRSRPVRALPVNPAGSHSDACNRGIQIQGLIRSDDQLSYK